VLICQACKALLLKYKIPKNYLVNNTYISYKYYYPSELYNLSPVEEKLISFNIVYSYIIQFIVNKKNCIRIYYYRHIKGHIIVFLNNIEGLTANVLLHPLLKTIENIYIS